MPGSKPVDNRKLYEILGLEPGASEAEIKKAHRKMVLTYHPDKPGGDPEKIKDINRAYEVLRDADKRRAYDKYGEAGAESGGQEGFAGMFRRQSPQKGEDMMQELAVTLEDLYNGTSRSLTVRRKANCGTCTGTGSRSKIRHKCSACKGSGMRVVMRQLAPGMVQQMHQACDTCQRSGYAAPAHDACLTCSGTCAVTETAKIIVHISRGHQSDKPIVLRGEAGISNVSLPPGDIVVVPRLTEHNTFKRIGSDLVMTQKLLLVEALTGAEFVFVHLDKRQLKVSIQSGEVIDHSSVKKIADEGMPLLQHPDSRGNLYIQFHVQFPKKLSQDVVAAIKPLLPSAEPQTTETDDVDEVSCEDVADIQEELAARARQPSYDSDEDAPGGQNVQCAQQ